MIIYTVKRGDTLYSISRRYGTSVERLAYDNQIDNALNLVVGQALVITSARSTYTVLRGDSLYSIANTFGTTVSALLAANPSITNPGRIYPGWRLSIPVSNAARGIDIVGFSVNTSEQTLNETLPYLTYISPFSYQVDEQGNLSDLIDSSIIETSRENGVASLMCVTNTKPGGGFSSDIVHMVLTDQQVQDTFIENVEAVLQDKNYYGVIINFEYVYPFDKESYNQFLRRIAPRLHALGHLLVTAIAPKTSADQPGTLYEAHDYAAHGEICDLVIIMTYEWGYTYGPAMAVSPIGPVQKVLDYAITEMPAKKILMGMPNYGYNWTLPFVQGTAAQIISNTGAVRLAANVGAEIMYDDTQQAPYFNYYDGEGRKHEVWFDDARSYQARFGLVDGYGLAGAAYWTIGSLFRQGLIVQRDMYNTNKVIQTSLEHGIL